MKLKHKSRFFLLVACISGMLIIAPSFIVLIPRAEAALLQKGMGEQQCLETNTIHAGDSIMWINYFDRDYQVTSVDSFDHVDGNFDSGLVPAGSVFIHSFDSVGEYLYFCAIPHTGHGLIRVVEQNSPSETDPVAFEISEGSIIKKQTVDGSVIANLVPSTPQTGATVPIQIYFTGKFGEPLSDVNFVVIALQDSKLIPIEYDDRQPDGKLDYKVGPLISDNTLVIQLKLLGIGHPNEIKYLTVSPGEIITMQIQGNLEVQSPISKIRESKLPVWFTNVLNWYDENLVMEQEVVNAFQFLVDNKIIRT